VLREIFGPNREKVTADSPIMESLMIFTPHQVLFRDDERARHVACMAEQKQA
jgi:hypothetical protein